MAIEPDDEPDGLIYRKLGIGVLVLVLTIAVGAAIGQHLGAGVGQASRASDIAILRPADAGSLLLAPKADPTRLKNPEGIGSQHAGIAVVARSQVDAVDTPGGSRRAPEGSTMMAFRVGNWTCEAPPCGKWQSLDPQVSVDGVSEPLPDGGNTFVVVVPPGTNVVELVINADGYRQTASLLDSSLGANNIKLLSAPVLPNSITMGQNFQLTEQTSVLLTVPGGQPSQSFIRNVSVVNAQRRFFLNGATPSSPGNVFLVFNAFYTSGTDIRQNAFDPLEVRFVLDNGKTYTARDLDPSVAIAQIGFEIPAKVTKGTFVLGGVVNKVSTSGVAYTTTLATQQIPITLD